MSKLISFRLEAFQYFLSNFRDKGSLERFLRARFAKSSLA